MINQFQLQEVVVVIKHFPRMCVLRWERVSNLFYIVQEEDFRGSNSGWTRVWRPTRLFDAAKGTILGWFLSIHPKSLSVAPWPAGWYLGDKSSLTGKSHLLPLLPIYVANTHILFPFPLFRNFSLLCVAGHSRRKWGSDVHKTATAAGTWRPEALCDDKRWDNWTHDKIISKRIIKSISQPWGLPY